MRCAGEGLSVDGGHFLGIGPIYCNEHDAAWSRGVRARVDDNTSHVARCGLQRCVAKVCTGAIEIAVCTEARKRIGIRPVWRPEISREEAFTAENAEVIRLSDCPRNVIESAALVFRNGYLHPWIRGVDLVLQVGEDLNRLAARSELRNPGIFDKCRVPEAAW